MQYTFLEWKLCHPVSSGFIWLPSKTILNGPGITLICVVFFSSFFLWKPSLAVSSIALKHIRTTVISGTYAFILVSVFLAVQTLLYSQLARTHFCSCNSLTDSVAFIHLLLLMNPKTPFSFFAIIAACQVSILKCPDRQVLDQNWNL